MTNEKSQLSNEIKSLVAKILKMPEDKVFMNSNLFSDLGVDSLSGVEIFAALDQKYHIDIPENKLKSVHTLGELIDLVIALKS